MKTHNHTDTNGKPATPADGEPTMSAITQDAYGGPETLQLKLIPRPTPSKGEVLVKVHAAGVDRGTWHLMTGKPYLARLAFGIRRPRNPVPGSDVAGIVVAVGDEVSKFVIGEEVLGLSRSAYAQYALVPAKKLARKPANISFVQAAVVAGSGITALQGLLDIGQIQAGQNVLICGASGGVGSFAVQLAKARGAKVFASASTAKLDFVRSLGADHVIDYTQEDFAAGGGRFDVIFDLAGNPSLSRLRSALTAGGTVVIGGGEEGGNFSGGMNRQLRAALWSPFIRHRLTSFIAKEQATDIERLCGFIEAGTVVPALDRTFPLDQAAAALRYLQEGKVLGKVAITFERMSPHTLHHNVFEADIT